MKETGFLESTKFWEPDLGSVSSVGQSTSLYSSAHVNWTQAMP